MVRSLSRWSGDQRRDFTYIDDIVEGVIRVLDRPAESNEHWDGSNPDSATSHAPYRLYNIGSNNPIELMYYIEILEKYLGRKAKMDLMPIQPGDVPDTYADVSDLERDILYKPNTKIEEGIANFVDWYLAYYKLKK